MKLKALLFASAAVICAAGIAAPTVLPELNPITAADAAVSASISVNTFYSGLRRHGDWVRHNGIYVFVPIHVADGWRPYTVGHWVWTRQYGWMWVSDEPFGWATYHYGRWGYADDIGWYWVPGTKWGPAWVSWRRSPQFVAWAPLPPLRHANVIIDVSFGDVPDYYWIPVPTRSFLEINISVVVIKDRHEREQIVRDTEPVGPVKVVNNIVVNNVIDVDFIEKETKKEVKEVEVKPTDQPEQAKVEGDAVAVFQGDVKEEADAKPAEVKDVEEVKQVQAKRKDKPTENAGEASTEPPADEQQQQTGDKEKPAEDQKQQQTGETPPADQQQQEQTGEKEKPARDKKQQQTGEQPPADQQQQEQTGEKEKPARDKKQEQTEEQPPADQQQQEQTGEKEKPAREKKQEQATDDQGPPAAEDVTGSVKRENGQPSSGTRSPASRRANAIRLPIPTARRNSRNET